MPELQPFEVRSADHLRLVLENSHIGIWELDLMSGLAVRNRTHDRIFGYDEPRETWTYEQFLRHVVDDDRARVDSLQNAAIEERREWSFDCQIQTGKGEIRWIKVSGRPLVNDAGEAIRLIGHVLDITDVKHREAMLQLVTDELNHRVLNMLSVIRSMIRLTASTVQSTSEFAQTLEGRVGALARTHEFIGGPSSSMLPSAIIEAELAAYQTIVGQTQISIGGEARLSASASKGLALVTHELVTNAIKHGALSVETGLIDVAIDWCEHKTSITWIERGGPTPKVDRREGFGSMLISQALAGQGTVEQVFSPEGLECRITLFTA